MTTRDDELESGRTPSRRRPPRADVVTYQVTVDLDEASPRIWRQLEVASDTRLDELHPVLQVAMGWTNSHLHEFRMGSPRTAPPGERFAMDADLDEGEPGVPEADVRLDEVLRDVGDTLLYSYDFGDGWDHAVRLDAVVPRPDDGLPARCTGGGGACPPEDCGGVWGYQELLATAADPSGLNRSERAEFDERLAWYFPGIALPQIGVAATLFDLDKVNVLLAQPPLPTPLVDLLDRAHGPGALDLFGMIDKAGIGGPLLIDAAAAARMVEPFAWLVRHVGVAGLPLTAAGYLKPADVEAVAEAIGISDDFWGATNRESQTYPVLAFRQAAQKLGLLRVAKGWVRATRAGVTLASDPMGLWWHVAARLPLSGKSHEDDGGLVTLLAAAAGADRAAQAAVMTAIGWMHVDGSPLSPADVRSDAGATLGVLERMGVYERSERYGWSHRATRDGVAFARAALRTWP